MSVETDLVTLLQAQGLTLYPGSIPVNGAYPCVVYQRISTPQVRSHQAVELEYPRFQLSCWAKTYKASIQTAETVKNVLDLNQTNFELATRESEFDLQDEEATLYRRVLEYFLWTNNP